MKTRQNPDQYNGSLPARLFKAVLRNPVSITLGVIALTLISPRAAEAAFGYTASNGGYIVNNGTNLEFTVDSSGDITSCKYKGTELNDTAKASGIASGLGASSVTATLSGNYIKITCVSTSIASSALTHYYIIQNGVDNIYMADYVTAEPTVGELRYSSVASSTSCRMGPRFQ